MRGWVGLRAGLEVKEMRTFSFIYRESNPDSTVIQPIT
jgi:hypothetical protein